MMAVCDMGPLHYLVLIGCDHILPRMFERVITARVVIEQEMADPRTPEPVRRWAAAAPQWLEILEPQQVEDIPSLGKPGVRGDGDRAIISLARELGAHVLVMDDAKARREAKKRGIKPLWMLEILDEAAERGLIDDLAERLEHLEGRTSFYVGEKARAVILDMKQRDTQRKLAKEQQPSEQTTGEIPRTQGAVRDPGL
jgi:predicted nucleic acid-binding protein